MSAMVLTVLDDPQLADSADRVAAAVGVPVMRRQHPGARHWTDATAIILDAEGARRCIRARLPRRDGVLLVSAGEPPVDAWSVAIEVGAQQLCSLPAQEAKLVHQLAEVVESGCSDPRRGRALAVIAGRGGGGASVFATALARCAGDALLIDLDACGGGIDLLVGAEESPGLRWADLKVRDGRLAWAAVRQALPRRDGVLVLSSGREFHDIEPAAFTGVLDAGLRGGTTVVCDVPRQLNPVGGHALESADLVVVVTSSDVRGTAATAALSGVLRTLNPNVALVVRGPAPGGLGASDVARATGLPLLAAMRPEPGLDRRVEAGGWRLRRRSPLTSAAQAVLAALGPRTRAA